MRASAGRAFARPKMALDLVHGPWSPSVLHGGENSLGGHRVFPGSVFLEGSRGDTCKSRWWLRPVRGLLSSPGAKWGERRGGGQERCRG